MSETPQTLRDLVLSCDRQTDLPDATGEDGAQEYAVVRQPTDVETWVLNEKAFVGFLEREPRKLTKEDSRMLAEVLARYVREQFDR